MVYDDDDDDRQSTNCSDTRITSFSTYICILSMRVHTTMGDVQSGGIPFINLHTCAYTRLWFLMNNVRAGSAVALCSSNVIRPDNNNYIGVINVSQTNR